MCRSALFLHEVVLQASVLLVVSIIPSLLPGQVYAQTPQAITKTVTATEQGAVASITVGPARAAHHPSRVLVRFRNGPRDLLPGSGAPRSLGGRGDVFVVPNPPGLSVAEAVRSYKAHPNVLYAEPDYEVQTSDTPPSDPRWVDQWDMRTIAAPAAWDTHVDASDVVVAIVDTGIDGLHEDLQSNLWRDPNGTGFGFTCINGSCVTGGQDDHGHGTHVAGTIGASGNNDKGIAGINWKVKLIAFKFLDSNGSGYISDAVEAFKKIIELKNAGTNIRVTNNSWGGGGYSQTLKDALTALEQARIVSVCAAGNNGQNADVSPMYPGAYDNRGIISVLATDSNDLGAGFTNYGLAAVDLAAPGVNTYSTVPTGTCSLCDPSGYKSLSGTSMATPHVSGVMAALLHLDPSLTAEAARDVILDPCSYDAVIDSRAQSTSSGGRLNYYKVINRSRLCPPLAPNSFPTLTMGPDIFAPAGALVTPSATANDDDANDQANLRMAWTRAASSDSSWLFGWMAGTVVPSPSGSSASFTAPTVFRTLTMPYQASVADNRGGGASGQQYVTVTAASGQNRPPTGSLSVTPLSGGIGTTVTVDYQPIDPDGQGQTAWDLWVTGNGGSGFCCYTGPSTTLTFNGAGVFRVGVQAVDRGLELSARQSKVVRIGGATGEPPIARATLDRLDGPVPLTVNIDASASSDPDGSVTFYYIDCGGGVGSGGSSSSGTCTYNTPGIYWVMVQVQDDSGLIDLVSAYVVASPASTGGNPPATPTILTATPGNARVDLAWQASTGATRYSVKRAAVAAGPYSVIADVTAMSHTDYTASNCTTYYYVVSAWTSSGESANSATAQATLTYPSPPTSLNATATEHQVTLSWAGAQCASGYNVTRNPSSPSSTTKYVTASPYTDIGLTDGTPYSYVVSAVNASGESASSPQVSATPMAVPTYLTATPGDRKVTLTWSASAGATGYKVKRAMKSGGPYTLTGSPSSNTYSDTGLANGTTYYYVVSAVNASGESTNSAEVSATPVAAAPVPTLLSLTLSASKVKGGMTVTGTVTISSPAPTEGVVVKLVSSDTNTAPLYPPEPINGAQTIDSVKVTFGSKSGSFSIKTAVVTSNKNVKVTATLGTVSKQQTLQVTPR